MGLILSDEATSICRLSIFGPSLKFKMMEQKNLVRQAVAIFILITFTVTGAQAQEWKMEKRINVLFGLSQVVVAHGFNVEFNYISKRLIFDYSHGVSLEFEGNTVPADLRNQGIAVKMPWTTGFGIGYRLKEWINFRLEPKFHRFEFYYAGENQAKADEITSYNTFSLDLVFMAASGHLKKRTIF
jgi:hypothetical protein